MIPSTPNQAAAVTFSILPCQSKKEFHQFEQIPELLHSTNPSFTPPFPGSVVKLIEPTGAFAKQHGEIFPFIALAQGKPVGRIAAIINRSHNTYNKDQVGFFGFFECIEDPQIAKALFDTAAAVVQKQGMTSLRGPYNPSINDDCGLLTDGFHTPAFVSMPWNPDYYRALYGMAGLESVRTLYAWMIPLQGETPARVNKIVERLRKRANVSIRSINMKNLEHEMTVLHRLYNATLDRNWGFYPISLEDLLHAADDLKAIADPSLILFACADEREVAFSLSLPNVNELFYRARRRKGLLRFLEMALRIQFQRPKDARLCVLGVDPEYQNKGLSALLFYEAYIRTKARYQRSEVSWVEANNVEILEGAELMGGYKDKTYEIFEKKV
jgi:GNAT superfamily N-acetyltransferase